MVDPFYIVKTFKSTDFEKTKDEDSEFLGVAKGFVSTTHKDDQGDILTHNFVKAVTSTLKQYTTVFYNHKVDSDPIAKILKSSTRKMEAKLKSEKLDDGDDFHYGTYLEIGISKTAEKQWTLMKEGILNKFSIGGYIDDFEYNEDQNAFVVESGKIFEASFVGIPANNNAIVTDISKSLRKSLMKQHLIKEKGEIDMDKEELEALLKGMFSEQTKSFDDKVSKMQKEIVALKTSDNPEPKADDPAEPVVDEKLQKELDKYKEIAKQRAIDNEKLEKELASKGGRKTAASQNVADPNFINDPLMALNKGLMEFGDILKSGDPFIVDFIVGETKGQFTDYIKKGYN